MGEPFPLPRRPLFEPRRRPLRHALTQPTPNPYEGSFNSNLPFRDCSESCIFLSRTNVYHSITNCETFVPVSRPTFRLSPCVDWPVSSDISFDRDIFLPYEKLRAIISCVFAVIDPRQVPSVASTVSFRKSCLSCRRDRSKCRAHYEREIYEVAIELIYERFTFDFRVRTTAIVSRTT